MEVTRALRSLSAIAELLVDLVMPTMCKVSSY